MRLNGKPKHKRTRLCFRKEDVAPCVLTSRDLKKCAKTKKPDENLVSLVFLL